MNWEAVGVIAEVIGAAAVLATLVYLSIQMRLSRVASETQLSYSSVEIYSRWRTTLLQNSDLTRAIAKANRAESLTDDEIIQMAALMDELFVATAISHTSTVRSNSLHDHALDVEYVVAFLEANPGLIPHWKRFRSMAQLISPEYVLAVDSRLNRIGNDPGDDIAAPANT